MEMSNMVTDQLDFSLGLATKKIASGDFFKSDNYGLDNHGR
jgi:hypothetical protein